ncbi:MAG: AAA family ATPase [Aquificaceae bacterium]
MRIEKFLIFQNQELYFDKGLNVITGESGSGKSIFLSSIAFLMGEDRKSPSEALVEATLLKDGEEIKIKREVRSGKSRFYIKDKLSSKKAIKEVFSKVFFHGQHDKIKLTRQDFQTEIFDSFAKTSHLRLKLNQLKREQSTLESKISELKLLEAQRPVLEKALREEIAQIESCDLTPETYNLARLRLEELSSLEEQNRDLGTALEIISGLKQGLKKLISTLKNHEEINSIEEMLDKLSEIYSSISKKIVSISQEEIEELNQKIFKAQSLARRYKMDFDKVFEHLKKLKDQLNEIESIEIKLSKIEEALKSVESLIKQTQENLIKEIHSKKPSFCQKIAEVLSTVGLGSKALYLELSEEGIPVFLFGSEDGNLIPLKEVSGGELSRISLAVFIVAGEEGTYILDEVDAGLSGDSAYKMAGFIKELSKKMQVIAVTHSPILAGFADRHFKTYKDNSGAYLKDITDDRLEEIARLMGLRGESALDSARAIFELVNRN